MAQVLKLREFIASKDEILSDWTKSNLLKRLWKKDYTVWSKEKVPEIVNRLGWLFLPEIMFEQLDAITAFAKTVKDKKVKHVVLLGMGGSSLAPEVFQKIFGNSSSYPELIVLDSTHPEYISAVEKEIDLNHTIFIIASKSGTTLEIDNLSPINIGLNTSVY